MRVLSARCEGSGGISNTARPRECWRVPGASVLSRKPAPHTQRLPATASGLPVRCKWSPGIRSILLLPTPATRTTYTMTHRWKSRSCARRCLACPIGVVGDAWVEEAGCTHRPGGYAFMLQFKVAARAVRRSRPRRMFFAVFAQSQPNGRRDGRDRARYGGITIDLLVLGCPVELVGHGCPPIDC